MAPADVNVGVLVVFAMTSMGVYGIVLAGWSSNSKYSLLGGLRSSAQMISYELSYATAIAAVILLAGSMSIREIVDAQAGAWLAVVPRWYVFLQPIGFLVYIIAGVAETNRAPFDFPEAEQELVSGYNTGAQLSPLRVVPAGRVHQHDDDGRGRDEFVSGGWHGPFLPVERLDLVPLEGWRDSLPLYLGSLDGASVTDTTS